MKRRSVGSGHVFIDISSISRKYMMIRTGFIPNEAKQGEKSHARLTPRIESGRTGAFARVVGPWICHRYRQHRVRMAGNGPVLAASFFENQVCVVVGALMLLSGIVGQSRSIPPNTTRARESAEPAPRDLSGRLVTGDPGLDMVLMSRAATDRTPSGAAASIGRRGPRAKISSAPSFWSDLSHLCGMDRRGPLIARRFEPDSGSNRRCEPDFYHTGEVCRSAHGS